MEEENSKKMDVSYGVDNPDISGQLNEPPKKKVVKKSKKTKKNVVAKEAPKKKSLIDEINELKAKGETNTAEFRDKMQALEKVLGVDQISPFGTNELDVFENKLKGMSYADMRGLAYKVGLNPFTPQGTLKQLILKEFKAQNKNNMRNVMPTASEVVKLDPNNPQHQKTIQILGGI